MTNLYTIDRPRLTGYLRHYDPIKQSFCLLPYNVTSRPFILPQEYLLHFDDFLLPCNVPTQIVKPLTVIKHLVYSPLDNKDKFIISFLLNNHNPLTNCSLLLPKIISYMVKTEHKAEHKPPPIEHISPTRNTCEKFSSVLNKRTLRDRTHLLDPYN